MPPDFNIVGNLNKVIHFAAGPDARSAKRSAVDGAIGANFDIIINNNAPDLRKFPLSTPVESIPETIASQDNAGMENHAVANTCSRIENNAGEQDAVFSNATGFSDDDAGMKNAASSNLRFSLDDSIGTQFNGLIYSGIGGNLRRRMSSPAAFWPRVQVGSSPGEIKPGLFRIDHIGSTQRQVSGRYDATGSRVTVVEGFVFRALQKNQRRFIRRIPPRNFPQ
jgi:hypothetical protein